VCVCVRERVCEIKSVRVCVCVCVNLRQLKSCTYSIFQEPHSPTVIKRLFVGLIKLSFIAFHHQFNVLKQSELRQQYHISSLASFKEH
jgi:hypothetical protein